MNRFILIIIVSAVVLISCDQKFDKSKWQKQDDVRMYTYRNSMLNDLIKNQNLKKLSYNQLLDLLGASDKYSDSEKNILYYNIVTDYGTDIDPVYTKTLRIDLSEDSIVTGFKIEEWRK